MSSTTISEAIAKYVHYTKYSDLSKETLHTAKARVIDTIGCAIGASDEKPSMIARDIATEIETHYASSILGTYYKSAPYLAAFANGTMARYFDYNDTYDGKEFSHPSDNIMPVLAVAEAEKKTGRDALLGIVLAYEIQTRLADAAALWTRGWDHVIYGLVSVTAASSVLMGLTIDETVHAINIALDSHLTMRQVRAGEISMWKAAVFANAARNAIFAVTLAKEGMTGPSPIFEGEMGFWNLVSGKFVIDTKKFGNEKNKFRINDSLIKLFPAETRIQTTISCALEARKEFKSVEQIKSIEVGTNEAGYKILGKDPEKWNPKTKETADHSMPYVVAVALMDGDIWIDSFREKRFRDKKTLDFMKKIKVTERKEYTALFNKGGTVNASDIIVTLKDGKKITKKMIHSRGHPKNPMPDDELEAKFRRLTKKFLSDDNADYLIERVWSMDKLNDVERLFPIYKIKE